MSRRLTGPLSLIQRLGSGSVPLAARARQDRWILAVAAVHCRSLAPVGFAVVGSAPRRHFSGRPSSKPTGRESTAEEAKKSSEGDKKGKSTEEGGEQSETPESTASSSSVRGETMTLLGMTGFGLSMVLRNPAAAQTLRVAGPAGMALGVFLSVYQVGGWKLVFLIPLAIAGFTGAGYMFDNMQEESFKQRLAEELREHCPQLPSDFAEVLHSARGAEYETNKFRLEARWKVAGAEDAHWCITVAAERSSRFGAWAASSLEVAAGRPVAANGGDGTPPAQTRYWDSKAAGAVKYQIVWHR